MLVRFVRLKSSTTEIVPGNKNNPFCKIEAWLKPDCTKGLFTNYVALKNGLFDPPTPLPQIFQRTKLFFDYHKFVDQA
jgi:hypothetical protein